MSISASRELKNRFPAADINRKADNAPKLKLTYFFPVRKMIRPKSKRETMVVMRVINSEEQPAI